MTITTKVQLHCDVGLKCTKQIAKTLEGVHAGQVIRDWAVANGWGTWGQRDACPDCWKALHGPTEMVETMRTPEPDGERINRHVQVTQRDIDEAELQEAISLRRGLHHD